MKISTKGRYGLRALLDLAAHPDDGPRRLDAIAESQAISRNYLHSLMIALKAAGLVRSRRGSQGGYVLARPAREITLARILQVLEGPLALADCVEDERLCRRAKNCVAHDMWSELSADIENLFASVTLADLAARQAKTATSHCRPSSAKAKN